MFKCFDQINRELLYAVAKEAGMPPRILDTYFRYINDINVRFQVGQRIGPGHKDRCSIPQGCPYSMGMIALLMVPWVNLIKEVGVEPRVLADDLMFSIAGPERRGLTVKAMQLSRKFFADLGAKVAVNKCFTFASDGGTRRFLTEMHWDADGLQIPCVGEFRDLGTHFNLTHNVSGATITERMVKGIAMAKRLKWLPVSRCTKERIVRANILPASLYGAEAAHINKEVMNRLRAAIASAIGPRSRKRSVDLTFCFCNSAKDLDPKVHLLYNRLAGIRRMMAKYGSKRVAMVQLLIKRINAGCSLPRERVKDDTHLGAWRKRAHDSWQQQDRGDDTDEHHNPDDINLKGPVSFLMQDLARCGCALDENFNITQQELFCFNLWDIPWQQLKTAAFDLAVQARDEDINKQRTFLGELPAIDHLVTKAIVSHLGIKEQRVYAHIATGGFWGEDQIASINDSQAKCPHCGRADVDTTHINWECPEINKHRAFKELEDLEVRSLPRAVANGVPPAMAIGTAGAYWDGTDETHRIDKEGKPIFPLSPHPTHEPTNLKGLTNMALDRQGHESCDPKDRAQQVCHKLKAGRQHIVMPTPYRCTRQLPQEVNVYTDGSWLNSSNRHFALGGSGVWWPGRALARGDLNDRCTFVNPLSPAELEIGYYRQEADGVSIFASIGGYSGSSTRTEIAAGILAACGNGPVYIASDSEVFVNGVNNLMSQVNEGVHFKLNFKLMSDGDLWEHMYKVLCAKGPFSFQAKWVKGHATADHVSKGVITEGLRIGNHRADATADIGSKIHGEDVLTLMSAMTLRFQRYVHFMRKVAHHIIEGYLIHRAMMDIKARKQVREDALADKRAAYQALQYPEEGQSRILCPITSIHCFESLITKQVEMIDVDAFLANLRVTPSIDGLRGISWIELYILYRVRGGRKLIPNPSNPALPRGSADKQIRAFKRALRAVVERTLSSEGDSQLFKPGPAKVDNLHGVGILGKQACLSLNVHIPQQEREAIALALSMVNRGGPTKLHKQFLKGEVKLMPHVLKLKGKAAWDSNLPTMTNPLAPGDGWAHLFNEERYEALPNATMLACPGCGGVESSFNPVFQVCDLDRRVKCGFCKRSTPVRRWSCPCNMAWHCCSMHAGCFKPYNMDDSGKQPKGNLSSPVADDKAVNFNLKASRRFKTPEEVIEQDHRRAKALKATRGGEKRKADIVFEEEPGLKKPTRLGPILRERFGGASSSSSCL